MAQHLEMLPEAVLDRLVDCCLGSSPSLRNAFLASLGSRIHASTIRVIFSTLIIEDDDRRFTSTDRPSGHMIGALLSNPNRYGKMVKTVVVCDPGVDCSITPKTDDLFFKDSFSADHAAVCPDVYRPIDACSISLVLEACGNLEQFIWNSSILPPDGLCEMFTLHNPKLSCFRYAPKLSGCPPNSRTGVSKWDAPSLPLLSSLPLTHLHLTRLSQGGSRALCILLSNLGEFSTLEEMSLDFVWFDDLVCEKIAEAGRRLRKLKIGTSGTRLSDKGIAAIAEECDSLDELVLDEVQGRLSRSLWTKPRNFPSTLKHLRIVISETGPHHSWTTDHTLSIHAFPLNFLDSLSIVRREASPYLRNGVPFYEPIVDDTFALKSVPRTFVDGLKDAKALTKFECDWWSWSLTDIKVVLESCQNLESLKFCLSEPFTKLLGLTSAVSSLTNLRTISVCVDPIHAPGKPPVPLLPLSYPSLPTPTESPVLKARSVLPQLLDFDQMQNQTCLAHDTMGDPSMPLLRDVRRFVRKCPKLALLEWYGKAGRGSWIITRPVPTTSKISINVSVEYKPPIITSCVWKVMVQEKKLEETCMKNRALDDVIRSGHIWTGTVAENFAIERLAENKEDSALLTEKDKPGRARESTKRMKTPSISTSNPGVDVPHQLPTPTNSSHSRSPSLSFSPWTPPHSDTSISALACVSEGTDLIGWDEPEVPSPPRRRSPSEPSIRSKYVGNGNGSARSTTSSSNDPKGNTKIRIEHKGNPGKTTNSNGSRFSRGRGKKVATGNTEETTRVNIALGRTKGGKSTTPAFTSIATREKRTIDPLNS